MRRDSDSPSSMIQERAPMSENGLKAPPSTTPPLRADNVAQLKAEADTLRSEALQLRKELKHGEEKLKAYVFFYRCPRQGTVFLLAGKN